MHALYPDCDLVRDGRMVHLLEVLHEIRSPELEQILEEVAAHVAATFYADLADVFVIKPELTSLVALGISATSMGRRQRTLGLDRLPLVNGGRVIETFRTGVPYLSGRADLDPAELRGFADGLGVRSVANCVIQIGGERRGVLAVASAAPDAFSERDLRALGAAAGWVGLAMDRAERQRAGTGRMRIDPAADDGMTDPSWKVETAPSSGVVKRCGLSPAGGTVASSRPPNDRQAPSSTTAASDDAAYAVICMMCGRTFGHVVLGRYYALPGHGRLERHGRRLRCGHCQGSVLFEPDPAFVPVPDRAELLANARRDVRPGRRPGRAAG